MSIIKRGLIGILGSGLCLFSGLGIASPDADTMVSSSSLPLMDCVINPSEVVDLGTAVAGKVVRIHADRSDRVSQAQVLVELESSVEQAALALASNRAALSTSITLRQEVAAFDALTRKRNEELLRTAAISQHDADRIRSEARITVLQVQQEKDNQMLAQLERRRAEAVLALRTIRSPINGVVMERFKSVGEFVEDEPLLRIARLDPLHIEVIIPAEHMAHVQPGTQAEVRSVIAGSEPFIATVDRVDLIADAASGTFGARLKVDNPDYGIIAGLRCQVEFLPQVVLPEVQSPERDIPQECYKVGPFDSERSASEVLAQMPGRDHGLSLAETQETIVDSYIVLSESTADLSTLQKPLKLLAADEFLYLNRGVYKDRISFGVYKGLRSAETRKRALEMLGINTVVEARTRTTSEFWLEFYLEEDQQGATSLRNELTQAGYQPQPGEDLCAAEINAS